MPRRILRGCGPVILEQEDIQQLNQRERVELLSLYMMLWVICALTFLVV